MPQRPSKKKDSKAASKPGAPNTGNPDADRKANAQHTDFKTKSILGKFQGRKSI